MKSFDVEIQKKQLKNNDSDNNYIIYFNIITTHARHCIYKLKMMNEVDQKQSKQSKTTSERKQSIQTKQGDAVKNQQNMEEVQNWVRSHGMEIRSPDWIRQKYYSKLSIDINAKTQQLEKKEEVVNEDLTLKIFVPKSGEEIRQRYINKLMNMGIMKPQPTKKYQHLFIFDWDDTLLCTSFLSALNFLDLTPEIKQMIKKLDEMVQKLIELTTSKGEVYIITNATKGWVEYSSKLYLPITNSVLSNKQITIISARSVYGEEFPGDYGRWKIQAFKSILKKIDTALLTNMLCMGDSNIEIQAAHCLGKEFDKVVVKTIKFRENPRPDQMVKQLGLVVDKFREIFDSWSAKNETLHQEMQAPNP